MTLGKYRLIAELGRGGMAEVFLAVTSSAATAFSKLVVVKKPREHLADDGDFMTMLVDEGRIAARLNHPNLVQTLEVGEVNGRYFLTMEYLDGQPLHRLLSRARATIPEGILLKILADVLGGIHYAHELKDYDGSPLQVVHRDVTPHNCFITYEGQVKVVDFGIAKAVGRASETRHGVVKGKTAYMAPEQACGQEITPRVDVFAVGVMLYEAAARARMWKGLAETDIVRRLVSGDIPSSPKAVNPDVDDELDRICQRALMYSPGDRYPTAAAFQADLEKYLASKKMRPSAREIGAYVAELFADKRAMTDKIIGTQLAHLTKDARISLAQMPPVSSSSEASFALATPVRSSTAPVSAPPAGPISIDEDGQKTTVMVRDPVLRKASRTFRGVAGAIRASTRGLVPLIVAAIVLTAATVALTFFSFAASSRTMTSTVASSPTAAKWITVTLRATPPETRFSIDDGPLQENPYIGQVESDGREHVVHAVAPGYLPREETVAFTSDVSMRFTLSAPRKP